MNFNVILTPLLTIYDKSDQDTVAKASLEEVVERIKKDSEEE